MTIQKLAEHTAQMVNINDIDDNPGPFCMSFCFDINTLALSIKKVGLINSLLLIKNGNEKLTLITGYRRIHALKFLEWDKVPCRILLESEITPLRCLLLNLYDNLCTRKLNAVEKGMVLNRLALWLPKNEILKHYMPLLDLPSHEPTLTFYCRLEEELEEGMKKCLAKGILSLHTTRMLLEMIREARFPLYKLITTLKFNANQQKKLIEYAIDISHKKNEQILDVLEGEAVKKICSDTHMNNPQKVAKVLRLLRSRIYPQLTRAETTFKRTVAALDLPDGVRIIPPPYFEASRYRMEITFKDGIELKEKIDNLSYRQGILRLRDLWK